MAETRCTEIYLVLSGDSEDLADGERGEERHDKILEECVTMLEMEIRAASEMGGLLEEDGIGTKNLTSIYGDLQLLGRKDGVHDGNV